MEKQGRHLQNMQFGRAVINFILHITYNHLANGIINHDSFCLRIKLSPKQLISRELFKFPFWKLHKTMGTRGVVLWLLSWFRYYYAAAMLRPFHSFMPVFSLRQQHFYYSSLWRLQDPLSHPSSAVKACFSASLSFFKNSVYQFSCFSSAHQIYILYPAWDLLLDGRSWPE